MKRPVSCYYENTENDITTGYADLTTVVPRRITTPSPPRDCREAVCWRTNGRSAEWPVVVPYSGGNLRRLAPLQEHLPRMNSSV